MTLTERFSAKLKKIPVGGRIKLQNGTASQSHIQACYRAARKDGMKVWVRALLDGVWVHRIR